MEYELHGCPGEKISVRMHCPNCHCEWAEDFSIPFPNFDSDKDTHSATSNCEYETICCPDCGAHMNITLETSCCGSWMYIDELKDDDSVEIEYKDDYYEDFEDAILSNKGYIETFRDSMHEVLSLLDNITQSDHEFILLKMLEIQIVACLETYLSDALINSVVNDEHYIARFIETFKDYENEKMSYSKLIQLYENRKSRVLTDLHKLMYHNIAKIGQIYKSIFDIEFNFNNPDIFRIISMRHDLVHRNGKNKEGEVIQLTRDTVRNDYDTVYTYIISLDLALQKSIDKNELVLME